VLASPYAPEDDDDCAEYAPGLGTTMLGFHLDRPPFDDVRMRRAVASVVAPVGQAYADLGLVGRAATGGGLLPPAMPGHDHHVGDFVDVEGARALLVDAGHPGGAGIPPLQMLIASGLEMLHDRIRAALAEVGLEVEFTISPRGMRLDDAASQMWLSSWLADYPDPDGFFRGLLTDPYDPITDPGRTAHVVDLLNRARGSQDQAERLALYGEVDRLLVAEWVVLVPVSYARSALLRKPWVHGLWANALTPFRFDGVTVQRDPSQPPDAAE
jgi:ABC-type transport system substrate-binding protein